MGLGFRVLSSEIQGQRFVMQAASCEGGDGFKMARSENFLGIEIASA